VCLLFTILCFSAGQFIISPHNTKFKFNQKLSLYFNGFVCEKTVRFRQLQIPMGTPSHHFNFFVYSVW